MSCQDCCHFLTMLDLCPVKIAVIFPLSRLLSMQKLTMNEQDCCHFSSVVIAFISASVTN
jgi:hypothetical protein